MLYVRSDSPECAVLPLARFPKGALDSIALTKVPPVGKPSWAANVLGDLKDLRAWEGSGRD